MTSVSKNVYIDKLDETRTEEVIKRTGDKLYFKQKECNNLFNC